LLFARLLPFHIRLSIYMLVCRYIKLLAEYINGHFRTVPKRYCCLLVVVLTGFFTVVGFNNVAIRYKNVKTGFQTLLNHFQRLSSRFQKLPICFQKVSNRFQRLLNCFQKLLNCFQRLPNCFQRLPNCFQKLLNCFQKVSNHFQRLLICFQKAIPYFQQQLFLFILPIVDNLLLDNGISVQGVLLWSRYRQFNLSAIKLYVWYFLFCLSTFFYNRWQKISFAINLKNA
jgi:hypothetical protein